MDEHFLNYLPYDQADLFAPHLEQQQQDKINKTKTYKNSKIIQNTKHTLKKPSTESLWVPTARYIVRVSTAPFTRTELLHYEEVLEFVTDYKALFACPARDVFQRFLQRVSNSKARDTKKSLGLFTMSWKIWKRAQNIPPLENSKS